MTELTKTFKEWNKYKSNNFSGFRFRSFSQQAGKTYTTPSLRQYLIILKNFNKLKKIFCLEKHE